MRCAIGLSVRTPANSNVNRQLYPRFSGFYFFYFAQLGCFLPFWPLYLQHLGYNVLEIAQMMGLVMASGIIAPNVWGWLADSTGGRLALVRTAVGISLLGVFGLQWVTDFYAMAALLGVYSFFWYASMPLVEGITLTHIDNEPHKYVSVRLWGSLGFATTCTLLALTAHAGAWFMVPLMLLASGVGLLLFAWTLTHHPHSSIEHPPHITLGLLLRHPAVLGLLAAVVLMQVSYGPFYAFFSIYLEQYGAPRVTLAALWALGAFGEIIVFLFFARYQQRYGTHRLFATAFAIAAVRWVLLGYAPQFMTTFVVAQLLHAVSFGLFHAASVALIHQLFPGRMQSRGQALYTSLGYGLGGALGIWVAGPLWQDFGGPVTFYVAAVVALTGMLVGWAATRHPRPITVPVG